MVEAALARGAVFTIEHHSIEILEVLFCTSVLVSRRRSAEHLGQCRSVSPLFPGLRMEGRGRLWAEPRDHQRIAVPLELRGGFQVGPALDRRRLAPGGMPRGVQRAQLRARPGPTEAPAALPRFHRRGLPLVALRAPKAD